MEATSSVRVKLEKVESLRYPQKCPCCLGSPAITPATLVKGGAIIYTATWPHCQECARNEKRRSWSLFISQGIAVLGLLTLAIGSPVAYAIHPLSRYDGHLSLALGAILPILAIVLHKRKLRRLVRPERARRTGAGVMINYGGAHLMGGGYVIDVTFLQAEYAKEFIELNREKVVKVIERA